jgi:hypothetical protein
MNSGQTIPWRTLDLSIHLKSCCSPCKDETVLKHDQPAWQCSFKIFLSQSESRNRVMWLPGSGWVTCDLEYVCIYVSDWKIFGGGGDMSDGWQGASQVTCQLYHQFYIIPPPPSYFTGGGEGWYSWFWCAMSTCSTRKQVQSDSAIWPEHCWLVSVLFDGWAWVTQWVRLNELVSLRVS